MKKLFLYLLASVIYLIPLAAQTREALEDSVVVGGAASCF